MSSYTYCSEIGDWCEYNEHKKCTGYMHEGTRDQHWCFCTCHLDSFV